MQRDARAGQTLGRNGDAQRLSLDNGNPDGLERQPRRCHRRDGAQRRNEAASELWQADGGESRQHKCRHRE
jgi:hypothetical protein